MFEDPTGFSLIYMKIEYDLLKKHVIVLNSRKVVCRNTLKKEIKIE